MSHGIIKIPILRALRVLCGEHLSPLDSDELRVLRGVNMWVAK